MLLTSPSSEPDASRNSTVVQENNVRLRLNIVDTPGYGDLVNNENW